MLKNLDSLLLILKGFVDKVGQDMILQKSLKIPNLAEELPKKTAELVQKISTPIKNAVVQPLLSAFNIGKGGEEQLEML